MLRRTATFVVAMTLLTISAGAEQPATPAPATQERDASKSVDPHDWLKQFVGEWTWASIGSGTTTSEMVGRYWVINRMQGDMDGTKFEAIQTIGYDPKRKMYVGTWIDSTATTLWHYEGTVDASGKKLMLVAEGPSFADPTKMSKYRDSYEFKSPEHIVTTTEIQDEEGTWNLFMTGALRRAKKDDGSSAEPKKDDQSQ